MQLRLGKDLPGCKYRREQIAMAGLDKMKSQILNEARATADAKTAKANAEAEEILAQAKAEAEKRQSSISRKSAAEVANYKERVISSIDLQRRTKILGAKQEIIAAVLDKAYETVTGLDDEKYFELILKLLDKYALPQEGEIFFSADDLKRMPTGFEQDARQKAKENGGSLKVSRKGMNIENGFVLAYGGIEENCTLRAIFDAKRDELSDKVHRMLFS